MAQLGKYPSDRDCILHYMCTSEWSNGSFGDVESPTGYVWRITNTYADVHIPNTEVTSLIEDELKTYDIEDSEDFRESLVGSFLLTEDSNGFVSVQQFDSERALVERFTELQREYDAWAGQDDD